jgi:hypothetical protein
MSDRPGVEASEQRIERILTAKGRDALTYLRSRGRERFLRELQADGVPLQAAVAILDRAEKRLSREEFDRFFAEFVARSVKREI